ncbi:MAG: PIG-L family deacetylase [Terriglobia bacterium]
MRRLRWLVIICAMLLGPLVPLACAISVHGAPIDTGYNAGSTAVIRAALSGADPASAAHYRVFAAIEYAGSKSPTRIELHRQAGSAPKSDYQGGWPIAVNAPTGLYAVRLRVEDGSTHEVVASEQAPGFFVYRKRLRITGVTLDKAFYAPGERIRCEVGIENLSDQPLTGLRVEFSNENYPWISTFSGAQNGAGNMTVNPSLGLVVLRRGLNIPAHGRVMLPMEAAGTAAFLQGSQVAVMGAGGPARHDQLPPPEVDRYTIAVWDRGRKDLLDMQFSSQVIVREPGRVLPKPYSRNYTHPYNDEIDFTKYREFYPAGYISPAISITPSHTLYAPGSEVVIQAKVKSVPGQPAVVALRAEITNQHAHPVFSSQFSLQRDAEHGGATVRWRSPGSLPSGLYEVNVTGEDARGETVAAARAEIAFNKLPSSLMVFCPHEDDEHPWAGLMRAMVESGLPVQVVFYTGGDVGECERYFDGHPCDPVRAREFGTVRMEESVAALRHIGVRRDQIKFLGLPDGGSGEIWFRHIHPANPFLDIYLAVDHAPYEHIYEPNLPYARDSVIAAVKRLIVQYHPSMIAVPHPDERHVDHRTANWFTIKASQELLHSHQLDPDTVVVADRAYGSGGYKPAPYHYATYVVYLSGEAAMLKQEMGWIYQSQDGNLAEGAKRTFEELPRQGLHYRILDWQQHEGWNE